MESTNSNCSVSRYLAHFTFKSSSSSLDHLKVIPFIIWIEPIAVAELISSNCSNLGSTQRTSFLGVGLFAITVCMIIQLKE